MRKSIGLLPLSFMVMAVLWGGLGACKSREAKIGHDGVKLVLVGVDAGTWDIIEPLVKAGRLPNFARLMERGIRGPLRTFPRTWQSPVLWTSILTGKKPNATGIKGFISTSGFPVNSSMRKVKELGGLVSEGGYSAALVGFWASWPAEPLNGWRVSDMVSLGRFKDWTQSQGADDYAYLKNFPQATYPEELINDIYPLLKVPDDIPRQEYEKLAAFNDEEWARFKSINRVDRADPESLLKYTFASDLSYFNAGVWLLKQKKPEVFGIYFEGSDVMGHFFWKFMEPEYFTGITEREKERFSETIHHYYEFIDRCLGEFMAAAGEKAAVLVISDHGMVRVNVEGSEGYHSGTHARGHPSGIFLMAGPGVRRATEPLLGAEILDVTPTVLYYLGLPVGQDMEGKVLGEVFDQDFRKEHPVRWIKTYDTEKKQAPEVHSPMDKEIIDKLRALDYVK